MVHIDGRHFRGAWETWEDSAWGRMIEVTFEEKWLVRVPVPEGSLEHAAERCLAWCVREARFSGQHG